MYLSYSTKINYWLVLVRKRLEMKNYIESKTSYTCNLGGEIKRLTKKACNEIIKELDEECHDFPIIIRNCMYVIELHTIDGEKDIHVWFLKDYIDNFESDTKTLLTNWYEEGYYSKEILQSLERQLL